MKKVVFVAVAILLISCLYAPVIRAELVERIVAAVNNEIISWSDLQQALKFNRAFAVGPTEDKRAEAETLDGLINRRMLIQEARRLKFADVSERDIYEETDKLKKRFASDKEFSDFLTGLDMTERQLARMLGERLLVERFIEKKVILFVRISRDEAHEYFGAHKGEFKGMRFQEAYKGIVAKLMEQKTDQTISEYISELRSKSEIRINPR